jgi:arginine/ornithine N-succinyltransferase beta subunit
MARVRSVARRLLVAMHHARFCQRLLAELLPPRYRDGNNALWDAIS